MSLQSNRYEHDYKVGVVFKIFLVFFNLFFVFYFVDMKVYEHEHIGLLALHECVQCGCVEGGGAPGLALRDQAVVWLA